MAEQFIEYCENGELDNIKKMSLVNCDLEKGFRWACEKEYYNIVRYLIELYKTDINGTFIYKPINNEGGFRWACGYGRYNIVQYIIELYKTDSIYKPIDIHAENECGFRWACEIGYYNIVKYLMTLYKKHDYKPIKNYLMVFKKIDKYLL